MRRAQHWSKSRNLFDNGVLGVGICHHVGEACVSHTLPCEPRASHVTCLDPPLRCELVRPLAARARELALHMCPRARARALYTHRLKGAALLVTAAVVRFRCLLATGMAEHLAREIAKVDKYINDQSLLGLPANAIKDMRDAQATSLGDKILNTPHLDHDGASLLLAALGEGGWAPPQVTTLSLKVNERLERGQSQAGGGKRDNQHVERFDAFIPIWLADFWKSDATDHAKMQAGANFLFDLGVPTPTEQTRKVVITSFCQIAYPGVHLTYVQKYNLYMSIKNLSQRKWKPAGAKHAVRYPYGHVVRFPSHPRELSSDHYAHAYKDAQLYGVTLDLSAPVVDGVPARETHAGLRSERLADQGQLAMQLPRNAAGQGNTPLQQPQQQMMQQMCQALVATLTQTLGLGAQNGARAPGAAPGLDINFNPDQPSRAQLADAAAADAHHGNAHAEPRLGEHAHPGNAHAEPRLGERPQSDAAFGRHPSFSPESQSSHGASPQGSNTPLLEFKPRASPAMAAAAAAAGGADVTSVDIKGFDDVALAAFDSREQAKAVAKKAQKQAEREAGGGAVKAEPAKRLNGKQGRVDGPLARSVAEGDVGTRRGKGAGNGKTKGRGKAKAAPRKVVVKQEEPPPKRCRKTTTHPRRPRAERGTPSAPAPVVRYNGGSIHTLWKMQCYRVILCSSGYGGDRKVHWEGDYAAAFSAACDMIDCKRDSEL